MCSKTQCSRSIAESGNVLRSALRMSFLVAILNRTEAVVVSRCPVLGSAGDARLQDSRQLSFARGKILPCV